LEEATLESPLFFITMPWNIYVTGDQFCIHKLLSDGGQGERVGCHPNRPAAVVQLQALYATNKTSPEFLDENHLPATPNQARFTRLRQDDGSSWLIDMPDLSAGPVRAGGTVGHLEVLAAPYGGPDDGRDTDGEFFSPATDFQEDLIPLPPAFYYHGAETDSTSEPIGRSVGRWADQAGVWLRVALDMARPESQRVWQAASRGQAYASTGVVPASREVNAETGEIKRWLIGEVSLFELDPKAGKKPANSYAIARPLKTLAKYGRQVFEDTYLDDNGGTSMEWIDDLQETLAGFIQSLKAAGNGKGKQGDCMNGDCPDKQADDEEPTEEAALDELDTFLEALEDIGVLTVDDDDKRKALKVLLAAKMKKTTKSAADPAIAQLQAEVSRLQAESSNRIYRDWAKAQVAGGRLLPTEVAGAVAALNMAGQSRVKGGGNPLTAAIMKMVEARLPQIVAPVGVLSLAGFDGPQGGQDTIDTEYMARLHKLAGISRKERTS